MPTKTRGHDAGTSTRLDVRKTYKLYIGGAFPRSESGRSYDVVDAKGGFLANAARASRKDARDAVVAARSAFGGWSGATAYNRGQVLYRVAELMEGRRAQFVDEVARSEGLTRGPRRSGSVDAAIDRWVWYAGWSDKVAQVFGGLNPVAGPYFDISAPEPTGVVAALAPQRSSLLGLVSVIAPDRGHRQHLRGAVQRAAAAAVGDPGRGARHLRRARRRGQHPDRSHRRGRALAGLARRRQRHRPGRGRRGRPGVSWGDLERASADNLKRVLRPAGAGADAVEPDWSRRRTPAGCGPGWRPRPSGTPRAASGARTAPPFGEMTWPVTHPPSGPSSQPISEATSCGVPSRPTSVPAARWARDSSVSRPAQKSVSGTKPGATALAVPPLGPRSAARSYIQPCSAAFTAP